MTLQTLLKKNLLLCMDGEVQANKTLHLAPFNN